MYLISGRDAIKWLLLGWVTGKPSRYITNIKVNSAFHPSGVGKSGTCLAGVKVQHVHLCGEAGNTVRCHSAGDGCFIAQ